MTFQEWFNSAPHLKKYSNDHPAYLAAQEAWEAAHEACLEIADQCAKAGMHASMAANAIRNRSNT